MQYLAQIHGSEKYITLSGLLLSFLILRLRTILSLFFSGFLSVSNVFLPIITIFPSVRDLKCNKSSLLYHGILPSFAIPYLLSLAITVENISCLFFLLVLLCYLRFQFLILYEVAK